VSRNDARDDVNKKENSVGVFFFLLKIAFSIKYKKIFLNIKHFMVRYNNKHEKKERKKLQNRNKKSEIESGKIDFNVDPWDEPQYKDNSK